MYIRNCPQDKFETIDYGTINAVELLYWADINDLAMRNGWMNSTLRFIGTFRMEDCDDFFALFHDTEDGRNYAFNI